MKSETAYSKAAFICSKREYCTFQIAEKLRDWGMDDEGKIDAVIERLIRDRFLNDMRFVKAYVNDKIKYNHWGKQKVRFMLRQLQLRGEAVDNLLNDFDYDFYVQVARDVLILKFSKLREVDKYKLRSKLIQFMSSRGFEFEVYRDALDSLL
ncbi:MAG: regulatory protein RecX [Bacteroidales bacterium]